MTDDTNIKRDVEAELKWSPDIDETDIAVKVNRGIVTLTGFVQGYPEKFRAETAAKRVAGVLAVANDIAVRIPMRDKVADPQIARDAIEALKLALPAVWEDIKLLVHDGRVTLEGALEWHYQRVTAEDVVRAIHGVVSVGNSIRIRPRVKAGAIKHQIEEAFRRNAQIDADHVSVETHGAEVTLRGEVRSWAEHDQAQQTAWSAPGVTNVRDEITIRT